MPARPLSGQEAAASVEAEVAGRVAALAAHGKTVGLATVLVGDDPASQVYVRGKHRAAGRVGIVSFDHTLPAGAEAHDLLTRLSADEAFGAVRGELAGMAAPERFVGLAPAQTRRFLRERVAPALESYRGRLGSPPADLRV